MISGFINVNKPSGMSSAAVVGKIKKSLCLPKGDSTRVGHFGTLDPMASGVLPIAIGRATRLFDFNASKIKGYIAKFTFGVETDTLDSSGKPVEICAFTFTNDELIVATQSFVGKIMQVPPSYSALSKNGVRGYQLARKGENITFDAREIEVFSFKFIEQLSINTFIFEIYCSGGTYIRSLARDLAYKLGTVGHMSGLKRTQSGDFCIESSISLDDAIKNPYQHIIPLVNITEKYPRFNIPNENFVHVINGVKVYFENLPCSDFTVYNNDILYGIATNIGGYLVFKTRLL